MRVTQNKINLRRNAVLNMISAKSGEKPAEILESLRTLEGMEGVSLPMLYQDLRFLEKEGLIHWVYGSVQLLDRDAHTVDMRQYDWRRRHISHYAASLVDDGDRLFINGSSTALDLLSYLGDKHVTVFTNNGAAVGRSFPPGVQITLSGGELIPGAGMMTGDEAMRNLLEAHADKAFLGCSGISEDGDILCGYPAELGFTNDMLCHADQYFILADKDKIGKFGTSASFSLERPGTLITNENAPPGILRKLERRGMKIILVGDDPTRTEDGSTRMPADPAP